MSDLTGKTIAGRYEILERIGEGGFARVWKAKQLQPEGFVAVKTLLPDRAADKDVVDEFLREAALYVEFRDDPNVATILECGHDDENDVYFLVMTLLGDTVENLLASGGPLPPEKVFRIAEHIGHALEVVHAKGLVHRDIKCSNIMTLPGRDRFVLTDFGIGLVQENAEKTAGTQELKSATGTWAYASPEQIRARKKSEIGPQSDIYSLGVTLFRAATGEYPFPPDFPQVMIDHVEKPPPDPRSVKEDVPPALAELILRCMNKDLDERFADAKEFVRAVRSARKGGTTSTKKTVSGGRGKGRRIGVYAGAATALAVVAAIAVRLFGGGGAEPVRLVSEPVGAHYRLYKGEKARFSKPFREGVTPADVKLAAGRYSCDITMDGYFSLTGAPFDIARGEREIDLGTLEPSMALRVVTTPPAARAVLTGLEGACPAYPERKTPCVFEDLHAGRHELRLFAEGYVTLVDTVDVRGNVQEVSRTLEPAGTVTLWLFTDPAGAAARIDGALISQPTNCEVKEVPAGPHRLTFEKEGYRKIDTVVTINIAAPVDTLVVPLTPGRAATVPGEPALVIRSEPSGARILLNGESTGEKTPHRFDSFPTGAVTLRLERSCCRSYEAKLNIPAAGAVHDAKLSGYPAVKFRISTAPTYAEVFIDGSSRPVNREGMPPWDLRLACGAHKIRLKNDKANPPIDVKLTYTVRPGSDTESLVFDWQSRRVIERPR